MARFKVVFVGASGASPEIVEADFVEQNPATGDYEFYRRGEPENTLVVAMPKAKVLLVRQEK